MESVWRQLSRTSIGLGAGLAAFLAGLLGIAGLVAIATVQPDAGRDPTPPSKVTQTPSAQPTPPTAQPEEVCPSQDPDRGSDQGQETPRQPFIYEIAYGDTLSDISRKTGVSVERIAEANGIVDVNRIYAGSSLVIPTS